MEIIYEGIEDYKDLKYHFQPLFPLLKPLLMPEFRRELSDLLGKNNLPNIFCKDDKKWLDFILVLTQVLADQPIVNPTKNIAAFRYVDIKGEGVMANIDFRGSRIEGSITLGFGI